MRKGVFLLFALLCGALVWCARDKSPLGPGEGPAVCPQHEVPWPSLADSPWPMYRHDPQLTGRSQYIGPRKGRMKWIITPEEGGFIWEAVVVGADSSIFFTVVNGHGGGGQVASIYCVKPQGAVAWKQTFPTPHGEGFSAPILTSGETIVLTGPGNRLTVFSTAGTLRQQIPLECGSEIAIAPDGTLYLVDRSLGLYAMRVDGAVLWRATTEGGIWFPAGALSPDGATLYCYSFTPGSRAQLAALCAYSTDGTLQWKFRLPDKLWVSSGPVIGCNGCIYFGSGDGAEEASFWAITPGGQLLWRVPAFASGSEEATIAPDGRVIFYGDWDIICADHRGRLLWKYRLAGEPVLAAPLCDAEGVVYVFGHRVLAIDEAGCLLWEVSLPGSFTRIAGPAIGADGTLYVGTFGNPSVLVAIE